MTIAMLYPDTKNPNWIVSSGVQYNVGDLCYDSGSGGIALPGGSQASQGSEQADQILFAASFAGVCISGCSSTESTSNTAFKIVLDMGGEVWACKCPSQTWNHGDLVGIYSTGSASPDPQQVDACGQNVNRAIGKVFGYYVAATTTVMVIFFPKKYNALVSPTGDAPLALTTITTAAFAIPPHTQATYVITRAAADLMTLAAPTTVVDDGLVITLTSDSAYAHTITATSLLNTGAAGVTTATFAAYAGAGLTLMAYGGKWNVLYSTGITFS